MQLFGRDITKGPPIIVAEISANHNGRLQRAFDLIDAAKAAGADAIKFQVYEPHHITIECDRPEFIVESPLWKGRTLWELYSEAQTPVHWAGRIMHYANMAEIPAFPSIFCPEVIPDMELFGVPAYKIASMELIDIPLIKAAAATGKPIILSTGMATDEEIYEALRTVLADNTPNIGLLTCVSGYPTPINEANLSRLFELGVIKGRTKRVFLGLSDHTLGATVPIAATALGARMIEKHFCLSRDDGGPDAAFSMEPDEFKEMVQAIHDAWAAIQPSSSPSEDVNRKYRRSLYVVRDVKEGESFTRENVRSIRPANGMAPKHLPYVLSHHAAQDIPSGTPLSQDMIWSAEAD